MFFVLLTPFCEKFGGNVHLIAINKKVGGFFCVTHLVQKLLTKNSIIDFSTHFKAVFPPFACSDKKFDIAGKM